MKTTSENLTEGHCGHRVCVKTTRSNHDRSDMLLGHTTTCYWCIALHRLVITQFKSDGLTTWNAYGNHQTTILPCETMCYNAMIIPLEHYRVEGSSPSIGTTWNNIVMKGVYTSLTGGINQIQSYVHLWKQRFHYTYVMNGKRLK